YRANGMGGLRFFFNNSEATNAKRVNDSIYKRLDADKDGRLTQAELARLPQLLRQLDENEDELLTAQELNTEGTDPAYGGFAPRRIRGRGQPVPPESGLIEIPAGANPAGLVSQLLARYDRNKDGKLAKTEVAFDAKLFAELDANGDGLLDQSEL